MNAVHSGLARTVLVLGFLFGLAGCVTPARFSPAAYITDPGVSHRPSTKRTLVVCPAFDRLTEESRALLDPAFNPAAYLTNAVEKELDAASISHTRAGFAYSPSFAGVQSALQQSPQGLGGAVVIAAAINHFPNYRLLSCDFKAYSEHGQLLFEKRCLCMNFSAGEGALFAAHMAMQQLFGDPDFQKAIQ
jgi:hypothetical protein